MGKLIALVSLLLFIQFSCNAQRLEGKYFINIGYLINTIELNKTIKIPRGSTQLLSDSTGKIICFYEGAKSITSILGQNLPISQRNSLLDGRSPVLSLKLGEKFLMFSYIIDRETANNTNNTTKVYIYPFKFINGLPVESAEDSVYLFDRPLEFQNQNISVSSNYVLFDQNVDQALNVVRPINTDNFFIYTLRDDERSSINNKIYKLNFNPIGNVGNWENAFTFPDTSDRNSFNQIIISPNQRKMAVLRPNNIFIFNINQQNGNLELLHQISYRNEQKSYPNVIYGAKPLQILRGCFSPDNNLLYVVGRYRTLINNKEGSLFKLNISLLNTTDVLLSTKATYFQNLPISDSVWRTSYIQMNPNGDLIVRNTSYGSRAIDIADDDPRFTPDITMVKCPNDTTSFFNLSYFNFEGGRGLVRPGDTPFLSSYVFQNANKLQVIAAKRKLCLGDTVQLEAFGASTENYLWDNSPFLLRGNTRTPTFQANAPGRYTLIVTGSSACTTATETITLEVVALPIFQLPDTVVGCTFSGANLVVTSAEPNLSVKWSNGATTRSINVSDTGLYIVEVSNGLCIKRDSVRVLGFETPPQAVVNTSNTVLCNESGIAIAANNPNSNPLNRWRIIQGSGTIENLNNSETRIGNLPFGITKLVWEVAASRAVNCFSSDTLTIERRRLPVSNIIGRRSICPGLPVSVYRADTSLIRSGSIVWNVKKGRVLSIENNNSLIRIQWQNEVTDSAEVNLFAFGKNDCPMADTLRFRVRVSPNLLPEPVLSTDSIFCFSDSSAVFSIADPQPAATYQWQVKNAEIVGSSTNNSVQISWRKFKKSNLSNPDSLPQVWYSERIETPITVCNGVSDTFKIKYQADPTLAWQSDTFTCSNTAILIPIASNTPDSDSLLNGTRFTWQPNTYLGNPIGLQTSFLFPQSQFKSGQIDTTLQYIRTTRTAKGCLFLDTVNIKVFSRPQAIDFSLDSSLCLNDAQEINVTNFSDSLNYFFAISSDTSAMNNLVFNPLNNSDTLLAQNTVGRFKVAIFNLNKNGCSSDTTIKFYTINPLPNPNLSGNNKYICPNFLSNIPYRVQGKAGSSFSWSISGGRAISDTGNQVLVNWDNVELRSLQVTETDSNGCITQSQPLDILLDKNVDNPESGCKLSDYPLIGGNVLTLNGDGINEQITFRNINFYGDCKLVIFNRYGTPIISIPNYQTSNNYSPTTLADGMYYYQLQSARAIIKGWLVVVR